MLRHVGGNLELCILILAFLHLYILVQSARARRVNAAFLRLLK